MFSFKVYIGLDTNGRDVDSHSIALDLAAKYFPNGHTVVDANGRWNGAVGVIDEPTLIVEVITDNVSECEPIVRNFAGAYKIAAYQESVLITKTAIEATFV
jgi:hypothetical protein